METRALGPHAFLANHSQIPVHDRETGAVKAASLFVAVLGTSSYTYAEATLSQETGALDRRTRSHV
jgi:transposase